MSELFASLPGTHAQARGLFLDVWGTLAELPKEGFPQTPDDVQFYPGVLDALFGLTRSGYIPYLIGNERGVSHGHVSPKVWASIEERLHREIAEAGVCLGRSYVCLDDPEGVAPHNAESVFFLPGTGAFFHAAHTDEIDLSRSWVIGDSTLELAAGWRAELRCGAVRTGLALSDRTFEVELDLDAPDLHSLLGELRSQAPRLAA